jgi:hypothetical protein
MEYEDMELFRHCADLTSRIEDQLIKKFNDKFEFETEEFKNKEYLDQNEIFNLMVSWLNYWIEEQPYIMEDTHMVLKIKHHLCETRIKAIYEQSKKWQIHELLLIHFKGSLNL